MAYWPPVKKSMPSKVQSTFRGSNRIDAFSIPDDMYPDMQNITSASYPAAATRPGYTLVGTNLAARVIGLGAWKQTELAAVANGNWYRLSGGAWSSLGSGLNAAANWSFTNFKGNFAGINLIGANGVDPIKVYDGSTLSNLSNAPAGGNYIEQFAQRVWCMVGGDLHGCASGNATNWATFAGNDSDPYIKTVETPAGELPVALKAGNTHLTIFFPNAIQELFGYVPSDFNTQPVTYNVGAVSQQAITSVEGTFYFVHRTGFYEYGGGTLPSKKFSQPIQDYINRINPAAISKCVAGSNGKYVYIAIPLDTATDPDTVIEYNTEFGIFCVWKGFAPLNMAAIGGTLYIGGVSGDVRQLGGTTDNGAAISYELISKPFGAMSLAQKVKWRRAWTTAGVPAGSTMYVALSGTDSGDTDFVTVQQVAADTVVEGTRIIVPTTVVQTANWVRYKIFGTGPVNIKEFAWEEEQLPIV